MTQPGFLKTIIDGFKTLSYSLLMTGRPAPIPGITGARVKQTALDKVNAIRSQRRMAQIWGNPDHTEKFDRRVFRTANRLRKRANSFCNNIDTNGNVIHN